MLRTSPRLIPAVVAALLLLPHAEARAQEVVQSGQIFTGVIQGNRSFRLPVVLAGYSGQQPLTAVEVTFDVRMSGEYTMQPTPVPPNGIVAAQSTTALSLGQLALGDTEIDFAPIPWVFPVQFPLNILWALDDSSMTRLTKEAALANFESTDPVLVQADIDISTLVSPAGWADPHLAGVFVTWEVRYLVTPPAVDRPAPLPGAGGTSDHEEEPVPHRRSTSA